MRACYAVMRSLMGPSMKLISGLAAATVSLFAFMGAGPSFSNPGSFDLVSTAEARTRVSVSFGVFQDRLAPYGRWVHHGRYGQIWVPARQRRGWRPYSVGHWVMTSDYGWMWASDEPWGWATYHYGAWDYDEDYGWYWVPGYVWGPAWVTWSDRGDYMGWAPIPAGYLWGDAFDDFFYRRPVIEISVDFAWCYTPTRYVGHRDQYDYVVPVEQNTTIIQNNTTVVNNITNVTNVTNNITNLTIVDNRVVNEGISVDVVNAVAEAPVQIVSVADAAAPPSTDGADDRGVVEIYRPVDVPLSADPAVIEAASDAQVAAARAAGGDPEAPAETLARPEAVVTAPENAPVDLDAAYTPPPVPVAEVALPAPEAAPLPAPIDPPAETLRPEPAVEAVREQPVDMAPVQDALPPVEPPPAPPVDVIPEQPVAPVEPTYEPLPVERSYEAPSEPVYEAPADAPPPPAEPAYEPPPAAEEPPPPAPVEEPPPPPVAEPTPPPPPPPAPVEEEQAKPK